MQPSHLQIAGAVALIATTMAVAACDKTESSMDVDVKAPAVASSGPTLTMDQWRRAVNGICREAAKEVGQASSVLTKQLASQPSSFTEAEISRSAYQASKPVILSHLHELAALRPPTALEDDYQRYIESLANELELSGRIAVLLGNEGMERELLEADANLGAAADDAVRFARRTQLYDCLGGHSPSG